MFGPLHDARRGPARPGVFSVTLTCRSGDEHELRAKLAVLLGVLGRRAPRAAMLCALDRAPKTGRWHVHALALLPPNLDPATVARWWCRCWPRGRTVRPARGAQHFRPLRAGRGGAALANDIDRVLTHHLGRTRKGVPIAGLPALPVRVTACGSLAGLWARVCHVKGIPVAPYVPPRRKRPSRARKVSTAASRPGKTWVLGGSCAWCAKVFPKGKRRGSRYCHRSCGSAASRALRAFEGRVGKPSAKATRAFVLDLERKGWLRRDAIRAATEATTKAEQKGVSVATIKVRAPLCRCGAPVAARSNAVTCGEAACRMKLLRRRRREVRRAARVHALFTELLRLRRRQPFTLDEARALGADLRVRARDVDELLRQLVDEDGTVDVVAGGGGRLRFHSGTTAAARGVNAASMSATVARVAFVAVPIVS
ncbi:MAG: hypothetical protein KF895_13490 [Parvibaculum sp.]|nr:hypothetical protein [Parvibaculum sp.]